MICRRLPGSGALALRVLLLLALGAQWTVARDFLRVPNVRRAPRLEDFVEGRAREAEAVATGFRQRQPRDGEASIRNTSAYLSYDDRNLYVVFVCDDDPDLVRARLSRREEISEDDKVGLFLDTFHDGRRAYMFFANPLGVQLDGITTEGQRDDYRFDAIWRSEGRRTATGYVVLMAIPFHSLRFNPEGREWGLALTRHIHREQEFSTWPRITDKVEALVPQFAIAEGIRPPASDRHLQIAPYGFLSAQRLTGGAGPDAGPASFRGGLDAKAVFRDSLTLDVTANPDFSQVESDDARVTVNRRYEMFYPEKRPFFLENASFFETPETLFFSRRIIDPRFGARLTGKSGPWSVGFLAADDRSPGELDGSGRRARAVAGRVQRDLGVESTAGVMVTSRSYAGRASSVVAADTRLKLNPSWSLTLQGARSFTRDGADSSSGSLTYVEARRTGRHLRYVSTYRDRSPGFDAALGFIPRVDIRELANMAAWRWRPEGGRLDSFGPSVYVSHNFDRQGRLQDWSVEAPFQLEFHGGSSLSVSRVEAFELYRGRGHRTAESEVSFQSSRSSLIGVSASYLFGSAVNYDPAVGGAPVLGSTAANVELSFRPSARLLLGETWLYTRLVADGSAALVNHVARSSVHYQFSRTLSLRGILDFSNVAADSRLVATSPGHRVGGNVLFTWLVHPSAAVYAGYVEDRDRLAFVGAAGDPVSKTAAGRAVFVKATYAFQF